MTDAVAVNIIVFGRGLVADKRGFELAQASAERVEALVAYVRKNVPAFNSRHGKIVFSGGWAAAEGIEPPLSRFREGNLMLDRVKEADICGQNIAIYADICSEIESDSTLENALRTKEGNYFAGTSFSACNPLGLVAHQGHMPRVDYLVRRVFGLPRGAVVLIIAPGIDKFSGGFPEKLILFITRLAFLGARSDNSLRRRHRILISCRNRLRMRRMVQSDKSAGFHGRSTYC